MSRSIQDYKINQILLIFNLSMNNGKNKYMYEISSETSHYIIIITLSTEVSERSNCRLVPYWSLGVNGSWTWSDTPFANT